MVRRLPRRAPVFVERLEPRALLTYSGQISASTVTLIGDPSIPVSIILDTADNKIRHSFSPAGFFDSAFDFDSATPGEQSIPADSTMTFDIRAGRGSDSLTVNVPRIKVEFRTHHGDDTLTLHAPFGNAYFEGFSAGTNRVDLIGTDAGDLITLRDHDISIAGGTVNFSVAQEIRIHAAGGDDELRLLTSRDQGFFDLSSESITGDLLPFLTHHDLEAISVHSHDEDSSGGARLIGGEGDDQFTVTPTALLGLPVPITLHNITSVGIDGRDGDDTLLLRGTPSRDVIYLDGFVSSIGQSADEAGFQVFLDAIEHLGADALAGADTIYFSPFLVGGNSLSLDTIVGGPGDDELIVEYVTFSDIEIDLTGFYPDAEALRIITGDGNDTVRFSPPPGRAPFQFELDLGDGNDTAIISGVNGDQFVAKGGPGKDGLNYTATDASESIAHFFTSFERLDIDAAGGDDSVELRRRQRTARVNGGPGHDTFVWIGDELAVTIAQPLAITIDSTSSALGFESVDFLALGKNPTITLIATAASDSIVSSPSKIVVNGENLITHADLKSLVVNTGGGNDRIRHRGPVRLTLDAGEGADSLELTGSSKRDTFALDRYLAEKIRINAGGGNDRLDVSRGAADVHFDGGAGKDSVRFTSPSRRIRIDVKRNVLFAAPVLRPVTFTTTESIDLVGTSRDDYFHVADPITRFSFDAGEGKDSLFLYGTDADDRFRLAGDDFSDYDDLVFRGQRPYLDGIERLIIIGLGGNDTFTVQLPAFTDTLFDGGDGHDHFEVVGSQGDAAVRIYPTGIRWVSYLTAAHRNTERYTVLGKSYDHSLPG